MSSNALLVTRRTPNPDLFRVFGPDCPVRMLDSTCRTWKRSAATISPTAARAAKVAACNALVTEAFSFRSRALDYLRLAGVDFTPADDPPRGHARLVIDTTLT